MDSRIEIDKPTATAADRPHEIDPQPFYGFCPICNSEGSTQTGEFIICTNAHAFTPKEALSKPRQLSLQSEAAIKSSDAPYGFCPMCGAKGMIRERRPNGYDHCVNGHGYKSSSYLRKRTGNFCPTPDCNSVRVDCEQCKDGDGTCGRGHVHKIDAFIKREIK